MVRFKPLFRTYKTVNHLPKVRRLHDLADKPAKRKKVLGVQEISAMQGVLLGGQELTGIVNVNENRIGWFFIDGTRIFVDQRTSSRFQS